MPLNIDFQQVLLRLEQVFVRLYPSLRQLFEALPEFSEQVLYQLLHNLLPDLSDFCMLFVLP